MNWKDSFPKKNRYYENENGILYYADSLEIMNQLQDNQVDLVLTDPPYGIGKIGQIPGIDKEPNKYGKARAFKREIRYYEDKGIDENYLSEIMRVSKDQIIWGGNYYLDYLGSTRCMLVWFKKYGLPPNSFSDCEIAWTSFDKNSMVFNARWSGFIRDDKEEVLLHPHQKPLPLFSWCITEFTKGNTIILDPFAGTGTTAVAAERFNRKWILIEKERDFCDIAVKRIKENKFRSLF